MIEKSKFQNNNKRCSQKVAVKNKTEDKNMKNSKNVNNNITAPSRGQSGSNRKKSVGGIKCLRCKKKSQSPNSKVNTCNNGNFQVKSYKSRMKDLSGSVSNKEKSSLAFSLNLRNKTTTTATSNHYYFDNSCSDRKCSNYNITEQTRTLYTYNSYTQTEHNEKNQKFEKREKILSSPKGNKNNRSKSKSKLNQFNPNLDNKTVKINIKNLMKEINQEEYNKCKEKILPSSKNDLKLLTNTNNQNFNEKNENFEKYDRNSPSLNLHNEFKYIPEYQGGFLNPQKFNSKFEDYMSNNLELGDYKIPYNKYTRSRSLNKQTNDSQYYNNNNTNKSFFSSTTPNINSAFGRLLKFNYCNNSIDSPIINTNKSFNNHHNKTSSSADARINFNLPYEKIFKSKIKFSYLWDLIEMNEKRRKKINEGKDLHSGFSIRSNITSSKNLTNLAYLSNVLSIKTGIRNSSEVHDDEGRVGQCRSREKKDYSLTHKTIRSRDTNYLTNYYINKKNVIKFF
jgi:hypothetical protein